MMHDDDVTLRRALVLGRAIVQGGVPVGWMAYACAPGLPCLSGCAGASQQLIVRRCTSCMASPKGPSGAAKARRAPMLLRGSSSVALVPIHLRKGQRFPASSLHRCEPTPNTVTPPPVS